MVASPQPAPVAELAAASAITGSHPVPGAMVITILLGVVTVVGGLLGAAAAGTAGAWVVAGAAAVWALGAVTIATRGHQAWLPVIVAGIATSAAAALWLSADASGVGTAAAGRAVALALVAGGCLHLAASLPDGVIGGRRRSVVAGGYLVAGGAAVLVYVDTPEISPAPVLLASLALTVAAVAMVSMRRRRASTSEVSRLWWAWCGALVMVTLTVVAIASSALTGWPDSIGVVAVGASVALPVALVLASFEATLPFAARALVGTIIASGLVLLAASVYVATVVGFEGTPNPEQRSMVAVSLVAAGAIALLAVPARRRLEVFANERVYGEREAPDAALHTFAGRMSRAVPMDELLRQLAETLHKSMRLRRAEVWTGSDGVFDLAVAVPDRSATRLTLGREESTVAARTPVSGLAWSAVWVPALAEGRGDATVRVAGVAHQGELLGFIVAERGDASDPDEEQDRVLTEIARQLGLALHNVRLDTALQASLDELQLRNVELAASRARIVAAADESRRHIERNLHDGAQQYLVAMAVKLGLARQLYETDPAQAAALLEELRSDVQTTLSELRELAHGIYPPLLRTQGLQAALVAAANRATLPTSLRIGDLPRFDADIEAAVYFCCLEAMQNAAKYAGEGASITVTVDHGDDELTFEVADDGVGFDQGAVDAGHGFVNMADRLGAMGGSLTVTTAPGEGTRVIGYLPDRRADDDAESTL